MLMQVFSSRKADTRAAFAILVRTEAGCFGTAVLAVYFALVAEETAAVGKAADVLAAALVADIGAIVFVHVFTVLI